MAEKREEGERKLSAVVTEVESIPYEIVVVGMGMAGTAAAITAHDAGARVLVLEKAPVEHAGGNARVSGQVWFSPVDVAGARVHLTAMAQGYPISDEVVGAFAEEAASNSEWVGERLDQVRGEQLRDEGDPLDPAQARPVRVPHEALAAYSGKTDIDKHELWDVPGHECGTDRNVVGGSMGFTRLWLALRQNLLKRGIEIRYSTPAVALRRDDEGSVMGVEVVGPDARHEVIHATRGVVIATGGFAASPAMTANYLRLPDAIPWGSPYNTGDGIRMGQALGGDLEHPYNYMAQAGIRFGDRRVGDAAEVKDYRYITVGADGKRFVDETLHELHGKSRLRGGFDFNPGVPMWTVFDQTGLDAGPIVVPREDFAVGWMKQIEGYSWSRDNRAEVEKGWIVKSDTIQELAQKLGVSSDGLEAEVARWNEACAKGIDDPRTDRPARTMTPIENAPFYGYRWAQLLITTLGGLRKDGQGRVIDVNGKPIDRLFAAGEAASSWPWLVAGGMSLGDALAFGRIAGRNAAAASFRPVSRAADHAIAQ